MSTPTVRFTIFCLNFSPNTRLRIPHEPPFCDTFPHTANLGLVTPRKTSLHPPSTPYHPPRNHERLHLLGCGAPCTTLPRRSWTSPRWYPSKWKRASNPARCAQGDTHLYIRYPP